MASYVNHYALQRMIQSYLTGDIRVLLVMTNSSVLTETDKEFIAGYTTLDEMNGANYARVALTSEAVNLDLTNDRSEFDAADPTWTSLGNGTRKVAGALIYKHVTNDADSEPILFIDLEDFDPGGQNFVLQFNAEGIMQGRNAA